MFEALRRWPGLALAAVTVAVLIAYYRQVFEGLTPAGYDMQTYFFPMRGYAREALLDGRVPLWTPNVFTGAPFVANPQTAVFYAFNLLLLPLAPAAGLATTVVLHVWLGAVGMAFFTRRVLGLRPVAAVVAALAFGLGGAVSAQSGHPNQIATIAWIPYLLWMTDRAVGRRGAALARTGLVVPALAVVVALLVTAGHPQQAYIALATGAAYGLFRLWIRWRTAGDWRPAGRGAGRLGFGLALGLALGAVQLLPSLFLSTESIRAGGLELYEAGSFSLRPGDLGTALLPGFTDAPRSEEYLAFVGFTGLWLAGLGVALGRRRLVAALVLVIATTLLLAVGPELPFFRVAHRWVPGFDLFRVPARWLLVMNVALALLAGLGVQGLAERSRSLGRRRMLAGLGAGLVVVVAVGATSVVAGDVAGRTIVAWILVGLASLALVLATAWCKGWWVWLLPLALALELFFALRPLELARPVPAAAFATGGPVLGLLPDAPGGPRTLGLADPSYEVNDADRALYARDHYEAVGEDSFRQFLVAIKYRDTLSPNLANAYDRPSPDGYDGGVLPLRDYVRFKSALLPGSETQPDGLLRNQFSEIPNGWVLDLMGVGYVLADRKEDVEVGGVFVDKELAVRVVGPETVVVDRAEAVTVERVVVLGEAAGSGEVTLRLLAGGVEGAAVVLPVQGAVRISAEVAATAMDRVRIDVPAGATLDLEGITLVDAAGRQYPLWLGPGAGLELLSWTDVKVYRRRDPAPRAALVAEFALAAGPEAAVAMVAEGRGRGAVLEVGDGLERDAPPVLGGVADWLRGLRLLPPKGRPGVVDDELRAQLEAASAAGPQGWWRLGTTDGAVEITGYAPEKVRLRVASDEPALLLLKDAIYPGWRVEIDGVEADLLRANVLHRAVLLPGGEHTVTFRYEPEELVAGGLISVAALVVVALLLAWPAITGRRGTRTDA